MEKKLEKIVGAPADVLDKTINFSENVAKNQTVKKAGEYWRNLGPGLTTGASDDDPSGIATYSQAGASYGFQLLWMAPFTFPLMSIVQEMCARIGLVTGRGLAANIRIHFPKWVLYVCTGLLFFANTLNIGADLGAMARSTQLIFPDIRFVTLVFGFAIVSLGLQIFVSYEKYARYLKWMALVLLSYILSALSVNLDFKELLRNTLIPTIKFSREQIVLIAAILGTTISPYLFFWQTSQEVEDRISHGETTIKLRQEAVSDKEIKIMRQDVWSGMFLSNLVMFFIIAATAATLFANGITSITTVEEAAEALRPIAGDQAFLLFTFGVIGTGMLTIPILAGSASYAISESFGWKFGLYRKLKEANAFYGIIIISTFLGVALNFVGVNPIKALILAAVVNGLVAPVILILIIILSSNKKIMGNRANHPFTTILGLFITNIMILVGALTLIFSFSSLSLF
ncbi:MAG: divalent metal cation transporter [Candidatus Levybacteria bacterium]|nr:divalent metal cation transporter [Candidatus Levybacteria bacterium]